MNMPIATSRRRSRFAAVTALAAATAAGLVTGGPALAATSATHALTGTVPTWATSKADVGATPSGTAVTVEVYLAGRDPNALAAYATDVSDPSSADYQHYLTPAAQNARFGPTSAQVSAVQAWLKGAGLKVASTTEQEVTATGDAAAVHAAFGSTLRDYSVSGHTYYAPQTTAVVPAAISSDIIGVDGLDNAPRTAKAAATPVVTPGAKKLVTAKGQPPYLGITPCASYYGQSGPTDLPKAYGQSAPSPVCGYLPTQIRDAYGVNLSGLSGKGSTVAVVDAYASPTLASDVKTFDKFHGIKALGSNELTQVVTPAQWNSEAECGGPSGWTPEESLDVESVHTMAPDAKVVYVGANSCNDSDFIAAEADIVDNHLASIVTNSWDEDLFDTTGNEPVATIDEYTQLFEQGAVEGIGFYFASGDCSTDDPAIVANGLNCDPTSSEPQVTFPASDPWVTGVGATAIGIGKSNDYEFETGMGDAEAELSNGTTWANLPGTFIFGTGGGTSDYFTQPYYQSGVVPSSLADNLLTGQPAAQPMREVPDVAMEGDLLAGTMVGFTQELPDGSTGYAEGGYGGTSVASPLFAGEQADAQQAQRGAAIGFANPEIYLRYRTLGQSAFHDVTDHPGGTTQAMSIDLGVSDGVQQGLLFTIGSDWTLHATPGYDDVTGVGSPNLGYLLSFHR
jgi:subtilase family serine protease